MVSAIRPAGYMVVSYLVRMLALTVEKALRLFIAGRAPGIYKHYYIRRGQRGGWEGRGWRAGVAPHGAGHWRPRAAVRVGCSGACAESWGKYSREASSRAVLSAPGHPLEYFCGMLPTVYAFNRPPPPPPPPPPNPIQPNAPQTAPTTTTTAPNNDNRDTCPPTHPPTPTHPSARAHACRRQLFQYYHERVPRGYPYPPMPEWKAGDSPEREEGEEPADGAVGHGFHHEDELGEHVRVWVRGVV